ncbi:hypothetical protein C8R43DRAFT_963912 [Mycena crocata]|nr:hypothetical protein C8R43DRAFT_963912 [Mycena crocata]
MFAYGSFGDILATAQLVAKIVGLIRRSGKPSGGWAETENTLEAFGGDLTLLLKQTSDDVSLPAFVAEQIHSELVDSRGFMRTILWAHSEEKQLAAFRMAVADRRAALGVVNRLDEVGAQVNLGNSGVRESVNTLASQVTMYHEQIVNVLVRLPRGISEEMFVIVSPTGVQIPISVVYCTSYQVLHGILKMYLSERREAGARYVECGDYNVVSSEGEVIQPPDFITTVKDGTRLEMGIIKRETNISTPARSCLQCGCGGGTAHHTGWITCDNASCRSRFRVVRVKLSSRSALLGRTLTALHPACATQDSDDTSLFRLVTAVITFVNEEPTSTEGAGLPNTALADTELSTSQKCEPASRLRLLSSSCTATGFTFRYREVEYMRATDSGKQATFIFERRLMVWVFELLIFGGWEGKNRLKLRWHVCIMGGSRHDTLRDTENKRKMINKKQREDGKETESVGNRRTGDGKRA